MSDLRELNWYPLVNSHDLPYRHPYRSKLLGHELVIWRADDGFVNVWLDRCLHRGMRLSRGVINGNEIKCQYHGWHYSNRSGGCTYIPAHPHDSPAQSLSCEIFKSVEKHGLVWSGISPQGSIPDLNVENGETIVNLRSVFVRAPADDTTSALKEHGFSRKLALFVQPLDELTSIVHGVLDNSQTCGDVEELVHNYNDQLVKIRAKIEYAALARPVRVRGLPDTTISIAKTSVSTTKPAGPQFNQSSRLKVKVSRKWITAKDIVGVELSPIDFESLPTFLPGAHIDLVLPHGLIRQYSLTNGPGELGAYRIGVKREQQSSGGSLFIHDVMNEGDVLEISMPRNNFPLRQDSSRTILIAGGIGVTPLLAMSQVLSKQNLHFELNYFAQSHEHLAFSEVTTALGNSFVSHLGLSPMETMQTISAVLGEHNTSENVYICGPRPMLDGAREIARSLEWPDHSVHFEYFKNSNVIHSDSTFIVDLARSALSLTVEPGQTILKTLRNNGVVVPSSCEQGACGTCLVRVLEGTPDHQDVYLNESERQRGDQILTCVSRALSEKLTLDI